jgi:hypothetical protein
MTHQCMQCGSPTRAGAKFCHQCGTPIATSSLPPTMPFPAPPTASETRPQAFESAPRTAAATEAMPAPTAYMSQMPQTYQPPMPRSLPPQKSRSGFKIVMITLAVIFALGIASVIGAAFFIRNQVQRARREFPQFPAGNTNPASVPDDRLGVPPYPGAKRISTKAGSFGPFSGFVVEYTTSDDFDRVVAFYRAYFEREEINPAQASVSDSDTGERSMTWQMGTDSGGGVLTIKQEIASKLIKILIMSGGKMPLPGAPGAHPPPPPPGVEAPPPPPDVEAPPPPRRR